MKFVAAAFPSAALHASRAGEASPAFIRDREEEESLRLLNPFPLVTDTHVVRRDLRLFLAQFGSMPDNIGSWRLQWSWN